MKPYYADEFLTLLHGDAADALATLPSESVQTCVTSPPYFGLRDYGTGDAQIGLEASPAEYVARLVEVFRQVRRVLAKDGTAWLNLGDSYAYSGTSGRQGNGQRKGRAFTAEGIGGASALPPKNLLGIPWRVAFALQDDGWILRSDIVWAKRNMMPEAVTDRPTHAHEYLFLLTKGPRYYYDADAIREVSDPDQEEHNRRYAREYTAHTSRAATTGQPGNVNNIGIHSRPGSGGRNARTVWSISSQPYPGAHFAVMPPEMARRCIAAGSREGDTVLDPFIGSGTTAMVANHNGRRAVGIDLSEEYLAQAMRRCKDAPPRVRRGGVMKKGKPLQRNKPLVGNIDTHRAWQDRSRDAAINRERERPVVEAVPSKPAKRKAPKPTGEALARRLVTQRSGGLCEIRVSERLCAYWGLDWSHRIARGKGGLWTASDGLHACRFCHAAITNTNGRRAEFVANGWILDRHMDPATTPVLIHGRWVLLGDDGTTTPAQAQGDAA